MKLVNKALALSSLTMLVSTTALAGTDAIRSLPDSGPVSLEGTVDMVQDERTFVLRDTTGTVNVRIEGGESVVLKHGDKVTVDGMVNKSLLGTSIKASKVSVHKNLAEAAGDAIEGRTDLSLEGAKAFDIKDLPKKGLVKVSGTVTSVDNEKNFTLKDKTGSIDIDVKSDESAAIAEGAEVTVIGRVDNGFFSKDIDATKVLVLADARARDKIRN